MFSDAEENLRHFIRQRKFWRRDARGSLELSKFPLQTKNCFPYSPPAARRALAEALKTIAQACANVEYRLKMNKDEMNLLFNSSYSIVIFGIMR